MIVLLWLLLAASGAAQTGAGTGSPEAGKALFTGAVRLTNGGPACASCHTFSGIGFPGGGSMGPDLTDAYSKLGPEGLDSSLETLYFPAMAPLYAYRPLTPNERRDVAALLQSASRRQPESATAEVAGIGLLGLVALIIVTGAAGRRRLKPVRRRLVERARLQTGRPA